MQGLMTAEDSTKDLVERAKEGDREAFDQLAEALRDRLRASIENWTRYQLGPSVDADEVLQETLVRAFGALGRFEWQGDDSLFRWLCGIAKRAIGQVAREARRAERQAAGDPGEASGPSPSKVLRRHERFDRLEAALEKLSAEHRQAILLCRIEGLTSAEVAERMNRSPAAVRQLLVRALRELRKTFGETESLHLPDRQLRAEGEADGD
jgi:RNA polymerase sigma-70 factor (ECF subfamily)